MNSKNCHNSASELFVVGIAASAGGLPALAELLSYAVCHKAMCFVVVSHIARFSESELASILERVSKLKAHQIEDGMRVEHCHLYVIPPNRYVQISDGVLSLTDRPNGRPNQCADVFFESIAAEYKSNAIGVVLSGGLVGQDGSQGVRAIKALGGHTYAQNPITAEYPEMPTAAISTGCIDSVMDAKSIGEELSLISWT